MPLWNIEKIDLPLKFDWKISRNTSSIKSNFIVKVQDENFEGIGEVAFNTRFGESEDQIKDHFNQFLKAWSTSFYTLEEFNLCINSLELPTSLRFGLESAWVHFSCKFFNIEMEQLLKIKGLGVLSTSFSLPIMEVGQIKSFIDENNLNRFQSLKIKDNGLQTVEVINEVHTHFKGKLRIDANEAFSCPDHLITIFEKLKEVPIEFIEQPLSASMHDEYLYLKNNINFKIMADESITTGEVTSYYRERFDGINIKLMKSGGYFTAIKQIRQAKRLGLEIMIGCMIESSLGISSAMNLAYGLDYFDLDGMLIIQKDPFDLVHENNGMLIKTELH